MTRFPKKKLSTIESLPHELVTEILSRVAASSVTDLSTIKLTSKKLNEFAEDAYVYKHVCLDKFRIVTWSPLSDEKQFFLKKCRKSSNPELLYREALVDFFQKRKISRSYKILSKAVKLGHTGALYVTCIVLLYSGNNEGKRKGIQLIGRMKKSKSLKTKVRVCRMKLIDDLKQILWADNPILREKPVCCTTHQRKTPRWDEDEDEDGDGECEACSADREVRIISGRYQ